MSRRIHETAKQWLKRAESNLIRASEKKSPSVYWEDLCFDAQQAAEKALKGIYIYYGKSFSRTHDIGELLENLGGFLHDIPEDLEEAQELSDYAVATRYPGWGAPVTEDEYQKALKQAQRIVDWARKIIQ